MATPTPPLPETTSSIGGTIEQKHPNHIRISSINPNGITISNLEATIQNVLDMDIDIQCYNEINLDTTKSNINQKLQHTIRKMSPASRSSWSSSVIPTPRDYKPGGTGVVTVGRHSGRVKSSGNNIYGRWSYQILDGKNGIDLLIVSIYQCCSHPTSILGGSAYNQQQIQFIDEGREDTDP